MKALETSRLFLRRFEESDGQFFYEMNNDPDVIRYTGDKAFENKEASLKLIKEYDQYEKYNRGRLTVILKETGELLGWCGLKFLPLFNETDLGYRFKKNYWNNGYATESAKACIDYGFQILNLPYIVAKAAKENSASIAVMKKAGFTFWKEINEHHGAAVSYRLNNPLIKLPDTIS